MARTLAAACLALTVLLFALPAIAQQPDPVLADIVIEGNTKTDLAVVRRVIGLEIGDPFPMEAFDGVWDRLEDCGYFAFVDIDTEEDDAGRVTLLVTLEEEQTTRFTPYVRYSRRHKYLLGAAVKDVNLGGRGETLELRAIAYRIQQGELRWTKPWLFGADRLSLILDAGWEQGDFVWRPFDYASWHTHVGLRQDLTRALYLQATGGYESFEQKDDYDWTVGGATVSTAAETRDTWLVRGLIGLDTRDNPFYPTRGVFNTFAFSYRSGADVDGQQDYEADLRGFVPLPRKAILALHAFGHMVDDAETDEYVLRWGGPETVRGAPYAGREGDTSYILSAEIRWPLFMMPVAVTGETVGLGLHAFCDVGDAYFEDREESRAMVSFGAGTHISLLSWQLRFEAAKERDNDWTFEFMDVFNF